MTVLYVVGVFQASPRLSHSQCAARSEYCAYYVSVGVGSGLGLGRVCWATERRRVVRVGYSPSAQTDGTGTEINYAGTARAMASHHTDRPGSLGAESAARCGRGGGRQRPSDKSRRLPGRRG